MLRAEELGLVLEPITAFLGGWTLDDVTCVYVAAKNGRGAPSLRLPGELPALLAEGFEVERSLWDRRTLIAELRVTLGSEAAAGGDLETRLTAIRRAFEPARPVARLAGETLLEYGIVPLHLLDASGHRFLWSIERGSAVYEELASAGVRPPARERVGEQPAAALPEPVDPRLECAFAALSLVLAELAGRLRDRCGEHGIAVEVAACGDVARDRRSRGEAGDGPRLVVPHRGSPFHALRIPVPFGSCCARGAGDARRELPVIPLFGLDEDEALVVLDDPRKMRELARRAVPRIPEQSAYMERLLEDCGRFEAPSDSVRVWA